MSTTKNLIVGSVKVMGNFDLECYTSWADAVNGLADHLGVELPVSKITNVFVSNTQPSNSETNDVWFRLDSSGVFVGVFIYSNGNWVQFWPQPNGIIWMYGDSTIPPTGYKVVDTSTAGLTTAQALHIMSFYHADSSALFYDYFAVTFTGI